MNSQRRSAVIEFVGLAGVGKSTISHRVAEILEQRGWRVEQPTYSVDHEMRAWQRRLLKLRLVTAEAIFHPASSVRSLRAILATRQASAADVIRLTVNWLFMSSLLRKTDRRTGVHIFDEGQLNALWSIGFSATSAGTAGILAELARQRSAPVVVALIEADIAAVRARLDLRKNGQSRLERTRSADDAWERAQRALQQVKATLQMLTDEGADVQVVAVRNRGREDLDALPNSLALAFEEFLGSPATRATAARPVSRASETSRPTS
jgi:AAA domain